METPFEQNIRQLLAPSLEAEGYGLVRVQMQSAPGRPILQIMIERQDGEPIDVEDCENASHLASAILDVEDAVDESYILELSSPGLERPLVRPEDFNTYAGHEAKVELHEALDGRRRFKGVLAGLADNQVQITCDGETVALPWDQIAKARLILTDDMFRQSLKKGKK